MGVDFIHVGFPKCASSWLQEVLFHQHPEVAFIGDPGNDQVDFKEYIKLIRSLTFGDELSFNQRDFAMQLESLMQRVTDKQSGLRVKGVSQEGLVGVFPSGKNNVFCARTLKTSFPDAKIVIIIRNQISMINSCYVQYLRHGGTGSLQRFLFDPSVSNSFFLDQEPLLTNAVRYFEYSHLIGEYIRLFGRKNVLVEAQERLKKTPDDFVRSVCCFLDISIPGELSSTLRINQSHSDFASFWLEKSNRMGKSRYHSSNLMLTVSKIVARLGRTGNIGVNGKINQYWEYYKNSLRVAAYVSRRLSAIDSAVPLLRKWNNNKYHFNGLSDEVRELLSQHYSQDNKRLQKWVPYDLTSLGYLMCSGGSKT